jgi:hypothetical protein
MFFILIGTAYISVFVGASWVPMWVAVVWGTILGLAAEPLAKWVREGA